jgi:hypothetical protein
MLNLRLSSVALCIYVGFLFVAGNSSLILFGPHEIELLQLQVGQKHSYNPKHMNPFYVLSYFHYFL